MPDFERLMRKLEIDMAPTWRAKVKLMAYHRGLDRARWEIAAVAGIVAGIILLLVAAAAWS